MNRILKYSALTAASVALLAACNKVSEPLPQDGTVQGDIPGGIHSIAASAYLAHALVEVLLQARQIHLDPAPGWAQAPQNHPGLGMREFHRRFPDLSSVMSHPSLEYPFHF